MLTRGRQWVDTSVVTNTQKNKLRMEESVGACTVRAIANYSSTRAPSCLEDSMQAMSTCWVFSAISPHW